MDIREFSLDLIDRAKADLSNFLSLLLFFSATALLFRSVQFALVVTASLGFHELGHAAALAWLHLKFHISFGLVGAWTWSSSQERARLSHFDNAVIHLAGPFFSLGFALFALVLNHFWQPPNNHLLILANFSAQVGFFNLLPLGMLTDGGKVVHRLILSLKGRDRLRAVILPYFLTTLVLVLYGLITLPRIGSSDARWLMLSLILVGTWMGGSLLIESTRSDREVSPVSHPLKSIQVYLLILLIWDMLIICLLVMNVTPFWLAPDYVEGYVQNVTGALELLARAIRFLR